MPVFWAGSLTETGTCMLFPHFVQSVDTPSVTPSRWVLRQLLEHTERAQEEGKLLEGGQGTLSEKAFPCSKPLPQGIFGTY